MIPAVIDVNNEALALPCLPPAPEDEATDRRIACLLLLGLERGYIRESECDLSDRAAVDALLSQIQQALSSELERVSAQVYDRPIEAKQMMRLLYVSEPDHWGVDEDSKAFLGVEASALYYEPLALKTVPLAIGVAVIVALTVLEHWIPLLIGDELLDALWYEAELRDDALRLAEHIDLDTLDGDRLAEFAELPDYTALHEALWMNEEPESLIEHLRDLADRGPQAVEAAKSYRDLRIEEKIGLLRCWLVEWRGTTPSLADHPLARWVAKVIAVYDRQVADGRTAIYPLEYPDGGDCLYPGYGWVVGLGYDWEVEAIDYHFERIGSGDEPLASLLRLDPLALSKTHATLMALAEGTALLACLSELNT